MHFCPRISQEGSLRCDAWALRNLKSYQNGKLITWAWISRGFTSLQQLADWNHNGYLEAAEEHMSRTKDGMESLYNIVKLDEDRVDDSNEEGNGEAQPIADIPLAGETVTYWAISDPNVANFNPIPLPKWFQFPIDSICLTWKRENELWQSRIKKRHEQGKDSLAPKSQKLYETWLKTQERVLVLDKKKQAVVKNPGSKAEATLRRTCLLLVVHPSCEPDDLWIKKWLLKLLQGQKVDDVAVPKEVDHFEGRVRRC